MSTGSSNETGKPQPVEGLSFKEAQDELEGIVRSLESGTLELEESLALYERGVALLRSLKTRLTAAEQKIEVLMGELEPDASTSPEPDVRVVREVLAESEPGAEAETELTIAF
ncbi:MAG: exodeoxyribonuclease VII small subunit [Coriobacteriales bacterium]|jgi:exodeoxyribonuclease VII small subunit|nr:exodeoxyribonuclease VII small subunit [Coriobacteriales bacterium]